ncbi:tetratricopeptide repeat protein [Fulvivirga maritima]|uniref:tetratricopeptide repeat protein n=1 Tax=Fulvivirga maritima TaxID=2904247 RepID=UPI001F354452|nr:tetratricopeptide repeat protein [Fulvivirga maritima]UII25070.1 tetratricopeptide repeat protein [Fulvivirga maritima]
MKSVSIFRDLKDELREADALNNIAVIYMELQSYEKAFDYFKQAALIYKMNGDNEYLVESYRNLSICLSKLIRYEDANKFIRKSIELQLKVNPDDREKVSILYLTAGNVGYFENDYDKAVYYYKNGLNLKGISSQTKVMFYFNIANSLQNLGSFLEARKWLNKGKYLQDSLTLPEEIILKHYNIEGEFYQLQGKHDKAIKIFNEAIHYATKVCANKDVSNSMELLSKSQLAIVPDSLRLSVEAYQRVEEECRQQLNLLLEKEIEDFAKEEKREKKAEEQQAFVNQLGTWVGVLILLLIGLSIALNRKHMMYKRDHHKLNKIRRVLNDNH